MLQSNPNIPIVGLPCSIVACAGPQVTVVCNCQAKSILMINGMGSTVQCPGCKRGRTLVACIFDVRTGQGTVEVGDSTVEEAK